MTFKLRSGNTTPFKRMGSSPVKQVGDKKETTEEYNARVQAEYDTKMQLHSDSTASYNNQVQINANVDTSKKLFDSMERDVIIGDNFDGSGDVDNRMLSADESIAAGRKYDTHGNKIIAGDTGKLYYHPKNSLTEEQIAKNEANTRDSMKKFAIIRPLQDEAHDLYVENIERGIHVDKGNFKEDPSPLKPGPPPEKPVMKIPSLGMQEIKIPKTDEAPIQPSKRKYMKTKGKDKYINLETGEVVKIKEGKKKGNGRGPGKRRGSTNLVTGKKGKKSELGY